MLCVLQREVFGDTFDLETAGAAELPPDALIPGMMLFLCWWAYCHRGALLHGKTSCCVWKLLKHVVVTCIYQLAPGLRLKLIVSVLFE